MKAVHRDLLFGLFALQNGVIDQGQLVAAFQAWTRDKDRLLADHLLARGDVDDDDRAAVEALVERHVRKHGGDVERSLASVRVGRSTCERLLALADPDLDASLPRTTETTEPDADATASFSVGSATSDGQRFRVLRPHARGGLGAVFVALDGELNREVALKQILDHHADDPSSRHRFLIEAEVTGGLEHPGIVPVYGLGTYADGRPFYAMRFIKGDSLKEAIERFHGDEAMKRDPGRRSLELRKLLRRFLDVCNAMEYAHARGVLHRDIKPGNVIVGRYGETLVVDWGLAKATGKSDPAADERTLMPSSASGSAETLPGSALGTPAYMSPEQARGDLEALGPRSDVYGLGATLYCLLTGRPPHEGDDIGEVLRHVQAGAFRPPRQLDPAIDRSLEAICLKAMATRPEDRYASCRALADDLERWLADEPVAARREPLRERALRWVRKHPVVASTAAAALVVGLAASLYSLWRERIFATDLKRANTALDTQWRRAEAREQQAIDAVKRFRDAVVENPELKHNPSLEPLRKALLKEPLTFFRSLREQLQADRDTRPESLVRLAATAFELGRLTDDIGDKEDALRLHRESRTIRERLARDNPAVTRFQQDLADSHNDIGVLLRDTGRPAEALAAFERARAILERLARDNPTVTRFQQDLADSHNNIGVLLRDTGRPAEALAAHERARAMRERLASDNPTVTRFQGHLADSHNNIGVLLRDTGRPAEALEAHERAREVLERLASDNPTVTRFQGRLADSHNNIGVLLRDTGRPAEALEAHKRAREVLERLASDNSSVTEFQQHLAVSHVNIGVLLLETSKPAEALAAFERARAILERLTSDNPTVTGFQQFLAGSHVNIGALLRLTGRPAEALASFERARGIQERMARDHPQSPDYASDLGATLSNLALIDLDTRRLESARERLREAIAWQKKALAAYPRHPQYRQFLANHLRNLIMAARGLGDEAGAAEAQRELVQLHASGSRFEALDARLAAVLKGGEPKDNAERLTLAQRAYDTRHFAPAARLWAEAIAADPNLGGDRQSQHPYNAACAAALAAAGRGIDEPAPDEAARAGLLRQALGWLRQELAAWADLLRSGPPQARPFVAQTLRHWQEDSDLAGVRDPHALTKLPESERKDFQALWDEVEGLLRRLEADAAGELPDNPFAP